MVCAAVSPAGDFAAVLDASFWLQNEHRRRRRTRRMRRRRRRRRVEKLAAVQTSAVPTESNSGNRCLSPQSPFPCSLSAQIHAEAHKFKLYLSWSTAGSEKRVGKSTTSHGLSSCGRLVSLLPTRRRQVHPQSDTTGGLEANEGVRFCFVPFPEITLVGSFLSDIPLPGSFEIKPSHSTASLTMKKGGFSFSAAGGPTPRDDSARSDRKENALPGSEVPPLSFT